MGRRTKASYIVPEAQKRRELREQELQKTLIASSPQEQPKIVESEEYWTEELLSEFPRALPGIPLVEWLPGYFIHTDDYEAYASGKRTIDVQEQRPPRDLNGIRLLWEDWVEGLQWSWTVENWDFRVMFQVPAGDPRQVHHP